MDVNVTIEVTQALILMSFLPRAGLWSCFSGQRDRGLWLNEGLYCKQLAVGADWMFLPPHTLPLASDTLLQANFHLYRAACYICIRSVKVLHEPDAPNFYFTDAEI